MKYDFSGWATRNDLKCSDGRTIRKDAFKDNDGKTVPLIWNHMHTGPDQVLGHALLENREEGVYAYCSFNNTEQGKMGKELVKHGDIVALSIFADKLKQKGGDVLHGAIREVSLVYAGANPGATIEFPELAHGFTEDEIDEAVIYTGDEIELYHSDGDVGDAGDAADADADAEAEADVSEAENETTEESEEETNMAEATVAEVFDTLTEEQKDAVYYTIGSILEENGIDLDDEDEGEEEMKHNVFDEDTYQNDNYLSHADMQQIFDDAQRIGSLRDAVEYHMEEGVLAHSIPTDGMIGPSASTLSQTYGFRDPDMLFPEAKSLNNPPEWIKRETAWVAKVMRGVHHTPFSRIKSQYANITEDEARAKGYIKGKQKKDEVFTLLKRTTTPQTVYKRQKLDRDDIIDITDFDVVAWIRSEMRMMLDEEIARAILIGDGRSNASDDKIKEDNIRPIATDVALFSVPVPVVKGQTDAETAKNFIDASVRGRKKYKGTGTPTLFTTADMHTEMLLLEDKMGHKLYKNDTELATALRVSEIVEVEVMEGYKVKGQELYGIIVNINDYNVGADKGGEINTFDDFDIDYNRYTYLIETRISGALIKPFSALILTEAGNGGESGESGASGAEG